MANSFFTRAKEDLQARLTPRAQAGVMALFVIAWFLAYVELDAWRETSQAEVTALRVELAMRRAAVSQDDLIAERARARAALERFQAGVPAAATLGLASAQIQSVAEEALRSGGLSDARVTVRLDEQLAGGLVIFEVEVEARDTQGAFVDVLREFSILDRPTMPIAIDWFSTNARVRFVVRLPAEVRTER